MCLYSFSNCQYAVILLCSMHTVRYSSSETSFPRPLPVYACCVVVGDWFDLLSTPLPFVAESFGLARFLARPLPSSPLVLTKLYHRPLVRCGTRLVIAVNGASVSSVVIKVMQFSGGRSRQRQVRAVTWRCECLKTCA